VWINGLREQDIIPQPRRTDFLEQVFWNIHDIIAVNTRLRDALNKRQNTMRSSNVLVILCSMPCHILVPLCHMELISCMASTSSRRRRTRIWHSLNLWRYVPKFFFPLVQISIAHDQTTERLPESRKLELNGYLTKPTTRLADIPTAGGCTQAYT